MSRPRHNKTPTDEKLRDEHARALKACEVLGMGVNRFSAADVAGLLAADGLRVRGSTVANWLRWLVNRGHLCRVDLGLFAFPRKQSAPATHLESTLTAPSKAQLMAGRAR